VIFLIDFFDAASRRHDDVILLPAIRIVSGKDFVFQQHNSPGLRAAHVQQLNCCVKKRLTYLRPTCSLQTAQVSVLWITRCELSCSIVSTTDKSIVWMNWNSGSSMSGAVLNSRFLTRLLTSGEEDIERVSMLKEGTWVQLIVTDNVDFVHICYIQCDLFDCYIFDYEIMPTTLASTFLFILQDNALADLRYGGRFYGTLCRS